MSRWSWMAFAVRISSVNLTFDLKESLSRQLSKRLLTKDSLYKRTTQETLSWDLAWSGVPVALVGQIAIVVSPLHFQMIKIWEKYIQIEITADSNVSAFWASSVQCWCLGWGLSLKSHPKCPTHVVHLSHARVLKLAS